MSGTKVQKFAQNGSFYDWGSDYAKAEVAVLASPAAAGAEDFRRQQKRLRFASMYGMTPQTVNKRRAAAGLAPLPSGTGGAAATGIDVDEFRLAEAVEEAAEVEWEPWWA